MELVHMGIKITCPDDMDRDEAVSYVDEELALNPKMKLVRMDISLTADLNGVELHPVYDTITRVRRITGYLSTVEKFNDAKRAEERDRVAHMSVCLRE